jgi:hypothetical protein
MSYTLIEKKTLSSEASIIEFTGIPQIYSDLIMTISARGTTTDGAVRLSINGSTSNLTARDLEGGGSGTPVSTSRTFIAPVITLSTATANTFGNAQLYFTNYAGSTNKSVSVDSVTENNGTLAYQSIIAGLWSQTAAITSLSISPPSGNLVSGSTVSLYGINRQQSIGKPKAIGGNITFANGYWVHTFNASGTFYAQQDLEVDALVVAGGGAGGSGNGGAGAGAGGYRTLRANATAGTYAIVVGSGGAGALSNGMTSGVQSSAFGVISAGGGHGGGNSGNVSGDAEPGGSGGGSVRGRPPANGNTPSTTPSQGNGGGGSVASGAFGTGGGGGAGAGGQSGSTSINGNGGAGSQWINGTFYAGGGGGGRTDGTFGNTTVGGIGGGGAGGTEVSGSGQSGTANTGGGGGGGGGFAALGGNGGSGIVIIRYLAD